MDTHSSDFLDLQAALAGEYSLQRELGRGGMGVVYLARDVQLDRDVAIKVLPSHLAMLGESRDRFLREARTAAGLSHPNIVAIHRVGEAAGFVFFVMAYVPGQTLGERLREQGALPGTDTMRIMREVAWALDYAHEHGVVHRDIKPDNILLERGSGRVLVTDFGIARSTSTDDTQRSDPGRITGTAHFMSPEQAAGEPLDGRSDLYSLGVVGYLAASGRLPFEGRSFPAVLVRQATEAAWPLSSVAPGVPTELASVIDSCLATDRLDRPDAGRTVARALEPKTDGPRPLPAALRSWLRARNPAQPVFVGLYTVAGITLIQFVARMLFMHRPFPGELGLSALLLTVPMLPIVGYHITQARRLFRAGYSLVDLRSAIGHNDAERRDAFALEVTAPLAWWQRYLQVASYGSIGQSLFGTAVVASGVAHLPSRMIAFSYLGSLVALGLSNAFGVPLLPASLRHGPRSLRDRLWTSRLGGWLARRMHAPTARASIGSTAFQPTEIALGCAAGDLFAGLPTSYRAQLAELPMLVKKLESRAVAARMQLDALGVAAPQVQATSSPRLQGKEETLARRALAEAVGALESIRLDLLRLHADGSSLAPITTLLDAARSIGADLERLIVAQRDVVIESRKRPQGLGFDRTPTPA